MLQHSRDVEKLQNRVSTPNFIRSRPSSYYQSTPASSVGRASPSLSADTSADRLQSLVSPKLAVVEPRRSSATLGNSPHLLTSANNRSSYYSAVDNPANRSLLDDVQLPYNSPEHMFNTPSRDRPASSRTKPIRVDVPPPTERPASSMGTFTRRDVPPDVVKSPPAAVNSAPRSRPPPQTNGGGGTREEEWYEYGCV